MSHSRFRASRQHNKRGRKLSAAIALALVGTALAIVAPVNSASARASHSADIAISAADVTYGTDVTVSFVLTSPYADPENPEPDSPMWDGFDLPVTVRNTTSGGSATHYTATVISAAAVLTLATPDAGDYEVQVDYENEDVGDYLLGSGTFAVEKADPVVTLTPAETTVQAFDDVTLTAHSNVAGSIKLERSGAALASMPLSPVGEDWGATHTHVTEEALAPAIYTATLTPEMADNYNEVTAETRVTITAIPITTSIVITGRTVTARATPAVKGFTRTPAGPSEFWIDGTQQEAPAFVEGVATYTHPRALPVGTVVRVEFNPYVKTGGSAYKHSEATVRVAAPTITARLTSARPKNTADWYRTHVTATFTCTPGSGALTDAGCPAPVLIKDGKSTTIKRSVQTLGTDGTSRDALSATRTLSGIKVDTEAPSVSLKGLGKLKKAKHTKAPKAPACVARDTTSGVSSCRVVTKKSKKKVTWTATAIDRAGNRASATGSVKLTKVKKAPAAPTGILRLTTAPLVNGIPTVRAGSTHTLEVTSATRPSYVVATQFPGTPRILGNQLRKTGLNTWSIRVTFEHSMAHTKAWNIGVQVGLQTHSLRVNVTR